MVEQYIDLSARFELFRQQIELTAQQKEAIMTRYTDLQQRGFSQFAYVADSCLTGSYQTKTLISTDNQVELLVVMAESQGETLPNAVLTQLQDDLSALYPGGVTRQEDPCLILDVEPYQFKLTPVILLNDAPIEHHDVNHHLLHNAPDPAFYMPTTDGHDWQRVTPPSVFEQQLLSADRQRNGMLIPLIQMMKFCQHQNKIATPAADEMEQIALESLTFIRSYREGLQILLSAYGWIDSPYHLSSMGDDEFGEFCRNMLFGPTFPENE